MERQVTCTEGDAQKTREGGKAPETHVPASTSHSLALKSLETEHSTPFAVLLVASPMTAPVCPWRMSPSPRRSKKLAHRSRIGKPMALVLHGTPTCMFYVQQRRKYFSAMRGSREGESWEGKRGMRTSKRLVICSTDTASSLHISCEVIAPVPAPLLTLTPGPDAPPSVFCFDQHINYLIN